MAGIFRLSITRKQKIAYLKANLNSIIDPGSRGKVRFKSYQDGRFKLDVNIVHRRRTFAEEYDFLINRTWIGYATVSKHSVGFRITGEERKLHFTPKDGHIVELCENGRVIHQGVLQYV